MSGGMVARGGAVGFILFILALAALAFSAPAFAQRQDGGRSLFERQPPPSQGFFLRRLFGIDEQPPVQQPPRGVTRPRTRAPVVRQERAKPQAANRVVVFGDWMGSALAQGLDEAFADMPNVAVVRRTRGDLGLVREDRANWQQIAADYLKNAKQKVTVAVLMLGMADRAVLRDGDEKLEPLSDRWKQIYASRVDVLLKVFGEHGVPVVWVGLPPVRDEAASGQYSAINAIVRERVLQAKGVYVDIWPGFVDDDNRFVATGPDVNGEETKLRFNDGIRFTRKGMDKVAHYAAAEIRRLLGTVINPSDVPTALPGAGSEPFVEIDKTVVSRDGTVAPDVGAAQPLTRTDVSPGGILLKGRTNLDAVGVARKALRDGAPSAPVPGRMDDYRLNTQ